MFRLFFLILLTSRLFANEEEIVVKETYLEQVGNMCITLFFLLLIAFGTLFFLKKLSQSRWKHLNASNAIKILEKRPLHQKAALYLIEVHGKGIVISESQGHIHVVCELKEGTPLAIYETENKSVTPFQEKLQKLLKKRGV